jgi:anti-sigma factor RsiW
VTCREVADFLAEYLNGGLSDIEREAFEHHLRLCPNCVEYLALYRTTVTLGRHAFDAAADGQERAVPEGLVTAILAARRRERFA